MTAKILYIFRDCALKIGRLPAQLKRNTDILVCDSFWCQDATDRNVCVTQSP